LAKRLRLILAIVSNKEHNENMKYDCITYVQESFLAMMDNLESWFFFETQAIELSFTKCNIGLWPLPSHKIEHMAHTTLKACTYNQVIISPLSPDSRNLQRPESWNNKETRGVLHFGLAIYIKRYLKAQKRLWKLKYFTMQKI
jgi:hypothetical protein